MVSAGLDTVPGNLIMGIAYLSTPHGQEIQERALQEINAVYPDGDAWERCLVEEKVPYVTALVKEVLRFWTVIPISLPRVSIKDIPWKNATIPAGTTFFMVRPILLRLLQLTDLLTTYRTPGQQTTTPRTSPPPKPSTQSATSTRAKGPAHHTTRTAPAVACARARTSRTASCTPRSCA